MCLSLWSAGTVSTSASDSRPRSQATVQATVNTNDQPRVPGAVGSVIPKPVQTASAPNAVASAGTGSTNSGGSQGSFPWLPVAVIGLGALALAGFALMRPRRAVTATATTTEIIAPTHTPTHTHTATTDVVDDVDKAPVEADETTTTVTTTTVTPTAAVTTAGAVSAAPPVAPLSPQPSAPSAPVQPAPTSLTCPNCGTVNGIKENFCHDCGQDLRPTRSALMAAVVPPPDVVTDDMPYLETLDRTDEQLEYVLSRPRVVIGTAFSSDIVVDSAFAGWQSVSPTHAELRREQDGYLVVDRGSQNGTFVNGARTVESILADGDALRLGDVRFVFHIPSPGDAQ